MKLLAHAWTWFVGALRIRRTAKEPSWVEPANAITRAIDAGGVGDLPPLRAQYSHRPVTLDDFPALAAALDQLAARPRRQAPVARHEVATAPAEPPKSAVRHERRVAPVSTRSARRRRHHRAA